MPRKIDPLNRKNYRAVNTALTVTDVKAAISFYQKAFGFKKRGVMNGARTGSRSTPTDRRDWLPFRGCSVGQAGSVPPLHF